MPYRIRFHLKNGKHFMHWQVRDDETGEVVEYIDPETHDLQMSGCKLVNSKATAKWIRDNNLKQVCAWVLCDDYSAERRTGVDLNTDLKRVSFNPMTANHWRDFYGNDVDDCEYQNMVTHHRHVFVV